MLDTTTKRRIDDCRDILVGKLPDPKAQIEQITIGLIYKFMDDMDKEAVELGGQAKFFTDYTIPDPEFPNDPGKNKLVEFSKYAWDKLMNPKVSAAEMLTLYSEAIEGMEKNPNIPRLFRDIFDNAYLPYRDPETLKLFLKTIGEFEYTHSEKLGDAFEYLLSVMGSQGDAGQFRTPRHIIDFLVAIIDPDKNDTIMDPACGTAGFLIAAYKHILLKNTRRDNGRDNACVVPTTAGAAMKTTPTNIYQYNQLPDNEKFPLTGDLLTPYDRKKLIHNFVGYDISPDMVRLSLVNLYLHGFSEPKIHEYDTLSSEERWNESFDIILANPPFMSPKGGIRPHKKFTINSNRSEVLFVDYIAEHLNAKGKAGIIVPEGIIFQSGTAYKDLRKMLVENYLYAVVSLPAGVFNPYSGVKTSILLMDKEIAKQRDEILFIKIDNDGYNLGAQRTAVKGGQLEEAIQLTRRFAETGELEEATIAHLVPKVEIAKNGDFNLSGERYKSVDSLNSDFEMVELGEVTNLYQPQTISQKDMVENGNYLVFGANGVIGKYDQYNHEDREVLITCRGATCGTINMSTPKAWITGNAMVAKPIDDKTLNKDFLFYLLKNSDLSSTISGAAQPQITRQGLSPFKIPLPPLSIQEEIVAEIEGYQKIIDGAKAVVANYKPKIDIDPDWETKKLGEISEFKNGLNFTKASSGEQIKIFGVGNFKKHLIAPLTDLEEVQVEENINDSYLLQEGDILFVRSNGNKDLVGRSVVIPKVNERISFSGFTIRCRLNSGIEPLFIGYLLKSDFHSNFMKTVGRGANITNLSQGILNDIQIPIPPANIQADIINYLNYEQELVNSNIKLIEIFEQKIKDKIAKVWGE
ncbi:MAG: N-6 DNA methylase [Spirosomataceae bacterium]